MEVSPTLTFKAGKLLRRGNQLVADTRKGRVEVSRSEEQVTLKWFERDASVAENCLEWKVGEGFFRHLENCTDGQAFGLRIVTCLGSEEFFMWIQEPDLASHAAGFATKLNVTVCSLSLPANASAVSNTSGNLRKSPRTRSVPYRQPLTFREVLSVREIEDMLKANESISERLFDLMPPSIPRTTNDLTSLLRCPQFQQTLSFMDESLQSGDLDPLLVEIGIDPFLVRSLAESSRGDYLRALLAALRTRSRRI